MFYGLVSVMTVYLHGQREVDPYPNPEKTTTDTYINIIINNLNLANRIV